MRLHAWYAIYLLAAVMTIISSACQHQRVSYHNEEGLVWHTGYHISYCADRSMADSIIAVLNRVGNSMNVFDPNSLASRVNSADKIVINKDFENVYNMSVRVNGLSGGAFDPTLGPLIRAWGFGKGHKATSDTLRIDSLLQFTGIRKTRIIGGILSKRDPRIEFNFSALAKGYGCDEVGAMFKRNGIKDYIIEIGGEIACSGRNREGGKWRISIDKPIISDSIVHDSQAIIEISGCGMATSGNYRNLQGNAGSRYGHTISAKTGRPARTDLLSATVVASTCMEADALATAMMAMGSEKSMELAGKLGLPVLLVTESEGALLSPEFEAICVRVSEP